MWNKRTASMPLIKNTVCTRSCRRLLEGPTYYFLLFCTALYVDWCCPGLSFQLCVLIQQWVQVNDKNGNKNIFFLCNMWETFKAMWSAWYVDGIFKYTQAFSMCLSVALIISYDYINLCGISLKRSFYSIRKSGFAFFNSCFYKKIIIKNLLKRMFFGVTKAFLKS